MYKGKKGERTGKLEKERKGEGEKLRKRETE